MRSRTSTWFECKISYDKVMDDGIEKKVTQIYVVDALSFTEAESCIIEEMSSYVSGAFEVKDIKKAAYREVFFSDDASSDRYYKCRLQFITLDEKTEKEKRSAVTYLVHASSLILAVKSIEEIMSGTIQDYVISSVSETLIMDVFEHQSAFSDNDGKTAMV